MYYKRFIIEVLESQLKGRNFFQLNEGFLYLQGEGVNRPRS